MNDKIQANLSSGSAKGAGVKCLQTDLRRTLGLQGHWELVEG